jgi:capping protein (actin filament) muscle Z-line, beta
MVEDLEFKIRASLNDVYFGKTKDIVNDLRSVSSLADKKKQAGIQAELAATLRKRGGPAAS